MNIDVKTLDEYLGFCTNEIAAVLRADSSGAPWARTKVRRLEGIKEVIAEVRRQKQMTGMNGKSIEVQDLEQRLRSAEGIIRQAARDTFGRDMTPKEFAEASSYDS